MAIMGDIRNVSWSFLRWIGGAIHYLDQSTLRKNAPQVDRVDPFMDDSDLAAASLSGFSTAVSLGKLNLMPRTTTRDSLD